MLRNCESSATDDLICEEDDIDYFEDDLYSPNILKYYDGTPYPNTNETAPLGSMANAFFDRSFDCKYMPIGPGEDNPLIAEFKLSCFREAVICAAPSLASIPGVVPTIQNLGVLHEQAPSEVAPPCELSVEQRAAIKAVTETFTCGAGGNTTCSYDNVTLGSIINS